MLRDARRAADRNVMLAQKIALESREKRALAVANRFQPNRFMFRRSRLLD